MVKKIIKDDDRFIFIENKEKLYQPGNYDQIIRLQNIDDDEICLEVDGDDWLPNANVFGLINKVYEDPNVWMTSGSFKYHDGRPGFAKAPNTDIDVRKQTFTLSHMRTWKSWLWKQIKEENLESKFIGKNFVFDHRLGERITEDIIAQCHQCGKPWERILEKEKTDSTDCFNGSVFHGGKKLETYL